MKTSPQGKKAPHEHETQPADYGWRVRRIQVDKEAEWHDYHGDDTPCDHYAPRPPRPNEIHPAPRATDYLPCETKAPRTAEPLDPAKPVTAGWTCKVKEAHAIGVSELLV